MRAYTTKYGTTVIKGDITQAPTLTTRVRDAVRQQGLASKPNSRLVAAEAISLVQSYPSLSAKQAVAYVVRSWGQ